MSSAMERLLLFKESIDFLVDLEEGAFVIKKTPMAFKARLKNTGLCLFALMFVGCGGFKANNHPDGLFQNGEGIYSIDQFGNYVNANGQDPRFRKARVTTESSPLRLKTDHSQHASAPETGPKELPKGAEIDVFWPTDIINNHIKVYVEGRTLWVTHKSSGGHSYVTLLEDIYLPQTHVPSSGLIRANSGISAMGPVASSSGVGFVPSSLKRISLSSSAINLARSAIGAVNLRAATVAACSFDPAVGNNSSTNNCYNQIVISQDFRNFVANHGQQCAVNAAREAFGRTPQKVLFHSSGAGQVDASRRVGGANKKSTHAIGQAFDLFGVSLFFSGSSSRKVLMHKNHTDGSSTAERQNHKFYWSFTDCWRSRVQTQAPCVCGGSKAGAITYTDNSAHFNHLHMSLPMCEGSRYNVTCI